ncbi:uncharacterized protein LOC131685264 isoform X2 [Topomyia yanbarensis]|uniref:uncharacterized protein LOC131685264 isoform X2 n=1 Tax=Topomyia yanbarensis TaxID=2498891 RepID=UPI00273B3DD9|nr:uncharacterized protein LOC131685264 isoform X2 [Topomyia yanbarensis]
MLYEEEFLNSDADADYDENVVPNTSTAESKKRKRGNKCEDDFHFVAVLEQMGFILLEKSQSPVVKSQKATAAQNMCNEMMIRYGISMTKDFKIDNMKARLKSKTDLKQTGNRKMVLNAAEKKLFELLGGVDNPSVTARNYGLSIGKTRNDPTSVLESLNLHSLMSDEALHPREEGDLNVVDQQDVDIVSTVSSYPDISRTVNVVFIFNT